MPRDSSRERDRLERDRRDRGYPRSRSRSRERNGWSNRDARRVDDTRNFRDSKESVRQRSRSRSRSPLDRSRHELNRRERRSQRESSPSRSSRNNGTSHHKSGEKRKRKTERLNLESCQGVDEEMSKMMGFGSFDTTKNKKVADNVAGMVKVNKPRKYRQYMNRKGGFNRPLDFIA